ncbi:MAG: hypothetical protein NVS4B3_09300 [Gemmatimonadaceae bacterium]
MRTAVVERPLDASSLLAEVAGIGNGASVLFVGTVRDVNEGRVVTGIDYSAYGAMAERELRDIARETSAQYGVTQLAIEHRIGALGLGDASVIVAVAHPRRAQAFDAARFAVEELKRRVPIWKREHYADGSREWVDPTRPAREGVR